MPRPKIFSKEELNERARIRHKIWYDANIEHAREQQRKHKLSQPEKFMLSQARARAKRWGLDFNLTIEDINIPEFCPILGIKLEFIPNKRETSPSIDRIDNDKGYIKGNCRVISTKANQIKGDLTISLAKKFIDYMEGKI